MPQYVERNIGIYEATIKQLDSKYIKDMYYSEVLVEAGEYILPETELVYDKDEQWFELPTAATVSLKAGETYFVNYNGTQYKCAAVDFAIEGMSFTVLGNMVLADMPNTGEPFVMMGGSSAAIAFGTSLVLAAYDDAESVTLSIAKAKEKIHYIDPKYIKNMYYGGDSEVILDSYALTNMDTALTDTCMAVINIPTELVVGKEYEVSIDGTLYTSTTYNYQGLGVAALGNSALLSDDLADFNTSEPFAIMSVPPEYVSAIGGNLLVVWATGNQDLTLSISTVGEEIHKIDNKYIDAEWMATCNKFTGAAIIEEAEFTVDENGEYQLDNVVELVEGKEYIVKYDGVEYTCTCEMGTEGTLSYWVLGNLPGLMETGDNGMPFIFMTIISPEDEYEASAILPMSETFTFGIYEVDEVPNKLPAKFLPDDLRVDIEAISLEAIDAICGVSVYAASEVRL